MEVAVLGYGTVGSGVVEVIRTNQKILNAKAGREIHLKYVLDLRDFPGDPVEEVLVHDYNVILNDPEVKIVVEVMGGLKPAYEFTKNALLAGKSVCTSNKELVAAHGAELLKIAAEHQCNYFFEASVGGGIPVIRPLNECLVADEILEISGILNGTTNYILTNMEQNGSAFDDVLKKAQELGYAERNPEADVEGYDACRKVAILSSLACGRQVNFEDIHTEGITHITDKDFAYAKAMDATIKLIGTSRKSDGRFTAMVTPRMLPKSHPLASVNGVMNAIFIKGNCLGDAMFYGAGAGKLPTASAVVSDVVNAAKYWGQTLPCEWAEEKADLKPVSDMKSRFFVRVDLAHKAKAEQLFTGARVVTADGLDGEVALVTEEMTEKAFAEKRKELGEVLSAIRCEA